MDKVKSVLIDKITTKAYKITNKTLMELYQKTHNIQMYNNYKYYINDTILVTNDAHTHTEFSRFCVMMHNHKEISDNLIKELRRNFNQKIDFFVMQFGLNKKSDIRKKGSHIKNEIVKILPRIVEDTIKQSILCCDDISAIYININNVSDTNNLNYMLMINDISEQLVSNIKNNFNTDIHLE